MITPERGAFLNSKYQELYDFFKPHFENIKNEGYKPSGYGGQFFTGKYYKPIDEIISKETNNKVSFYPAWRKQKASNMVIDKPTFFYLPITPPYNTAYTGYVDLEGGFYIQLPKLAENPLPPSFNADNAYWFSPLEKTNPEMFKFEKPPANASVYKWAPVSNTLKITSLLQKIEFLNWKSNPWEVK